MHFFSLVVWTTRALVANPLVQRISPAWRATPIQWPNTVTAIQVSVAFSSSCIPGVPRVAVHVFARLHFAIKKFSFIYVLLNIYIFW